MQRRRYKFKSTSYRQNDLSVKTKMLLYLFRSHQNYSTDWCFYSHVQTQGKITGKTDDTNVARCQKKNQHPQNTLRIEKD